MSASADSVLTLEEELDKSSIDSMEDTRAKAFESARIYETDLCERPVRIDGFNVGVNTLGELKSPAEWVWDGFTPSGAPCMITDASESSFMLGGQDFSMEDGGIVFHRNPFRVLESSVSLDNSGIPSRMIRMRLLRLKAESSLYFDRFLRPLGIRARCGARMARWIWRALTRGCSEETMAGLVFSAIDADIAAESGTVDRVWSENGRVKALVGSRVHSAPASLSCLKNEGDPVAKGEPLFTGAEMDASPEALDCGLLGGEPVTLFDRDETPELMPGGYPYLPCHGTDAAVGLYRKLQLDGVATAEGRSFFMSLRDSSGKVNALRSVLKLLGSSLRVVRISAPVPKDRLGLLGSVLKDTCSAASRVLILLDAGTIVERGSPSPGDSAVCYIIRNTAAENGAPLSEDRHRAALV